MSTDFKLISIIPDSTKEEVLNPTSNLIGLAFRGIAHKLLDPLVKYNIVKDEEVRRFAENVKNKTDKVPPENRDSSKLGLTYKAVEDATYQLNSETLREMFANLIASTVDNRKNQNVLPSFSSILKDLSPDDASLFQTLFRENIIPVCTIRIENKKTMHGVDYLRNLILFKDSFIQNQTSLDTLLRFGLIELNPEANLLSEKYVELYTEFYESEIYKKTEAGLPYNEDSKLVLDSIRVKQGNIQLSSLGKEFGKAVIID